ncbi:hypothetical protein [Pectobacterium polaris]|uniref:hypothetical protein n=1 Tax=Pectobacterium polaris TaxID=2042057 RepID=UPI0032E38F13
MSAFLSRHSEHVPVTLSGVALPLQRSRTYDRLSLVLAQSFPLSERITQTAQLRLVDFPPATHRAWSAVWVGLALLSESSTCSYAGSGYFVGVLPVRC